MDGKPPSSQDDNHLRPTLPASGGAPSHPPFGKYEILRELGRGGMGVVYEAMDTQLHRRVALKMLLAGIPGDAQESQFEEERFLREARLSANLAKHPNLVSVYEAGVIDGKRYLAMEFIDGLPMSKWRKAGSITIRQQVKVLRDAVLAVHHAHRQDVVHRDLKPDNILIDVQGQPHVTDFGLAKTVGQNARVSLTASGMVVGTPAYMSPEQAIGEKSLDHRTDIYAIGVMLYETLTGRLPFTGETAIEILMKAAKNPVPLPSSFVKPGTNPTLDRSIENICLKALARNPRERYATAEALANDLTRWLKGENVRVAVLPTRRKSPAVQKSSWLWVLAGAVGLLIVLGVFVLSPSSSPTDRNLVENRTIENEESKRKKEKRKEIDRLLADAGDRLREGKLVEALRLYDDVLRKDHTNADAVAGREAVRARELEADLAKADAFLKEGKIREAFRAYGLVSARDPANRRASAGLEEAQKKMEEAIARAKEAEIQAKSDAERQAAEQRRREEEDANRKAQELLKKEEARIPAARARDLSRRTLTGHEAGVWTVAFSPDGKSLASGSVDKSIRFWDVAKGTQSNRIMEGSGVFGLAFSKDGRVLASGNVDSTVKLWDLISGKEPRLLRGHQKAVNRVSFSPDGTLMASVSADGLVLVWDAAKGSLVHTLEGPRDKTFPSPVFLSKGKVLAYGSADGSIRFWDLKSGREARPPMIHEGLSSLALSTDGALLASGGWNRRINLWDAATGKLLRTCEGHADGIWSLAFSPDGRFLASASADRSVRVWEVETGKVLDTMIGHSDSVTSLAYHPDGKLLASGSADGSVKLWNVEGPASEAAWKKSIDLLALVDPRRDALRGTWRMERGRLISEPFENGVLRLPYEPPEEYDFRTVFTRTNGACATAQFFVHQGRPGIWDLNKPGVGFSNVGGIYSRENATFVPFSLQDGVRYVSIVQVRREGVRGWIDQQRRSDWTPSMGSLSTDGDWSMDSPVVLGLGNCETLTTFESIQVLEITGKGRIRVPLAGAKTAEAPSPGIAGFWKLNEGAGTTAADASGNKLSGKLVGGAAWVKAKSGGVRLEGMTAYVELPAAPFLDKLREGSYAVSAWFKPEESPGGDFAFPLARLPWFTLYYLAKNHFMMQHALAGGTFGTAMSPEGDSPPGAYHHVVGVVDRAAGSTRLYVGGRLRSMVEWTPNAPAALVWPGMARIGAGPGNVDSARVKGTVDSVRFYSRALTAVEVESLYKLEFPAHER